MYRCVICRFLVDLDDAVAPTAGGVCVCCRCFARETDSAISMSKALRKEVVLLLESEAAA